MVRIFVPVVFLISLLVGAEAFACSRIPGPELDKIVEDAFFIGKVKVLERRDVTPSGPDRPYIPFRVELLDSYKGPVDIVLDVRQGTDGCDKSVPEAGVVYEDVIFKKDGYYRSINQAISNIKTSDWQKLREKKKTGKQLQNFRAGMPRQLRSAPVCSRKSVFIFC